MTLLAQIGSLLTYLIAAPVMLPLIPIVLLMHFIAFLEVPAKQQTTEQN